MLTDPSPCLRFLVLQELLHRPTQDPESHELRKLREADPVVSALLGLQSEDGSWSTLDLGGSRAWDRLQSTGQALVRLGYLGFNREHDSVQRAVNYLFANQLSDGSWPLPQRWDTGEREGEGYSMIPLQTAFPLWGLATCGYATDPRVERAYDWLLSQQLPDGAWPTGIASGVYGGVAGYRRLPHSRWGCRSNTTAALLCLAHHPTRRHNSAARRALDLLLARETREALNVGFHVARLIGVEPQKGFLTYFAKFDLAVLLDLCWRLGADESDDRIADLVQFIQRLQGPYGLWDYRPHPEASRWITFDLLRSLTQLNETTDWLSLEPRTPFRAYPPKHHRY